MPRAAPQAELVPEAKINPVPASPERARLAEAIAAVAEIEASIAETSAAMTSADDDLRAARTALHEAEKALDRAMPRPVGNFTPHLRPPSSFWSEEEHEAYEVEDLTPPIPIETARAAVATATDARDSAKRLTEFHRATLDRLDRSLRLKRFNIDNAVRGVVRADPALATLAAEAKRLATRAAAAAMAFELATNHDVLQPDSPFYGCTRPADFNTDFDGWAVSRAWRDALERLKTDPAVELPI